MKFKLLTYLFLFFLIFSCSQINVDEAEIHYQNGMKFDHENQFDLALKEYEKAIKQNPDHVQAHEKYIYLKRVHSKKYASVVEEYEDKAEKNPDNIVYQFLLGRLTFDWDDRKPIARRIIQMDPEFPWGYLLLADIYDPKNNQDSILIAYKTAISLDTTIVEAYSKLAAAYAKMDSLDQAIHYYQKSIAMDSTLYWQRQGLWAAKLKKYHKSDSIRLVIKQELEDFLSSRMNDLSALNMASFIFYDIGEINRRDEIEADIVRVDTTGKIASGIVLHKYNKIDNPNEKLKFCENFIQQYPRSKLRRDYYQKAFNVKSKELKQNENELLNWFNKWIVNFPQDADAFSAIAYFYINKNTEASLKTAADYIEKGLAKCKNSYSKSEFNTTKGWIYIKQQRFQDAIDLFKNITEDTDRLNPKILNYLAYCYGQTNQLDLALETLALSLSLDDSKRTQNYFESYYRQKFGHTNRIDQYIEKTVLKKSGVEPYAVPDFELESLADTTVQFTDFKGKVMLVVFFSPT